MVFLLFSDFTWSAGTEIQALSFGQFAIANNSSVSTLTIPSNPSLNATSTGAIYIINPGQPGTYELSAYPPFTTLTVSIADFNLSSGISETLQISVPAIAPIVSDAAGKITFTIGATLSTSGTGSSYNDGQYQGIMNMVVSW